MGSNPIFPTIKRKCDIMMKIGLDLHGVISKDPALFSAFSKKLQKNGHEVHILTGKEKTDKLLNEIKEYGIHYDYLFSITSFHKKKGSKIAYFLGNKNYPIIDDFLWDSSKALYCKRNNINICIDDSDIYGKYFNCIDTIYIKYNDIYKKFLMKIIKNI